MKRIFDLELGAVRVINGIAPGLQTIIRRIPDGWIFYEARKTEKGARTQIVASTFIRFSDRRKDLEESLDLMPLEDRRSSRRSAASMEPAPKTSLQTNDASALLQFDDVETKNPMADFSSISISDADPSEIASKLGGAPRTNAGLLPPARYWSQILERLRDAGYSVKKIDSK